MWKESVDRLRYAHAAIQATLHNAHFETNRVPFVPADFLGESDRASRVRQQTKDRALAFRFSGIMTSDPELLPEFMSGLVKKVN